jgi:hypothetical protein
VELPPRIVSLSDAERRTYPGVDAFATLVATISALRLLT